MNPIPSLLKQSTSTLLSLLDDMFASCDDLYFDLASSASSNQEQNLFFESMREVRVRAGGAKRAYKKFLESGFDQLDKKGNSEDKKSKKEDATSLEEMALLDDEETERNVTLTTMVTRARAISKSSLHEIEARLQQLVNANIKIDEDKNPVDPGQLIQQFASSVDDMALEIKPRIILYKQFERIVVKRLPEFYRNFNQKLDEAGAKYERGSAGRRNQAQSAVQNSALAGLGENESLLSPQDNSIVQIPFNELSSLLHQPRPASSAIPAFTSSRTGVPIESQDLLNLLETSSTEISNSAGPFDLRGFVSEALGRAKKQGQDHSVNQVDEDVINLVAMFFDFALEDEDIPDSVKALLSRLQMPTLKVALKDNNFFSDGKHPCREFINRVSNASVGISPGDKQSDELIERIEDWIHSIQTAGDQVEQAFKTALIEINEYLKKVEKRSSLVEKRTSETAEGEAAKQLARIKAQNAIHELLENKKINTRIRDFIVDDWQQSLYSAILSKGEASSEWTSGMQVMQDLVWCAQSHQDDEKSSKRLQRILTDLEQRILDGLSLGSLSEPAAKEKAHAAVEAIKTFHSNEDSEEPSEDKESEMQVFETKKSSKLDLINQKDDETPDWKSMTALERQKYQLEQATIEYLEKAKTTEKGTWIEFKVPTTGKSIRCKLATIINEDTYIFVNRLGFKSLEKNVKEFALDMQKKRARILRSESLFDRSLGSMINTLRRSS